MSKTTKRPKISNQKEKKFRNLIESKSAKQISGAEFINKKDSFHYLRSGLDQITCKIAEKKGKTIIFDLNELKKIQDPIKQAKVLARMQQNMRLCNKFKVKTKVLGKEAKALQKILKKIH